MHCGFLQSDIASVVTTRPSGPGARVRSYSWIRALSGFHVSPGKVSQHHSSMRTAKFGTPVGCVEQLKMIAQNSDPAHSQHDARRGERKDVTSKHNRAEGQDPSESLIYLNSPALMTGSRLAICVPLLHLCTQLLHAQQNHSVSRPRPHHSSLVVFRTHEAGFEWDGSRAGL